MKNLAINIPVFVKIIPNSRSLSGSNGVSIPFYGGDISFGKTKVFIRSKTSFFQFFSYFKGVYDGILNGFFVEILLSGLGFRLIKLGQILLLKLGHAHYIRLTIPKNLILFGSKKRMIIFGLQASEVYQFAECISSFRSPDVYKKKGVQLVGRTYRIKPGKQK